MSSTKRERDTDDGDGLADESRQQLQQQDTKRSKPSSLADLRIRTKRRPTGGASSSLSSTASVKVEAHTDMAQHSGREQGSSTTHGSQGSRAPKPEPTLEGHGRATRDNTSAGAGVDTGHMSREGAGKGRRAPSVHGGDGERYAEHTEAYHEWNGHEEEIHDALLEWYDTHKRSMPWRDASEQVRSRQLSPEELNQVAYAVWVSEIMLQQTQVATVIDYHKRWMQRFPTVSDLAAAELEQVNEIWSGLGYYRRAKYLHQGAQYVIEQLGGTFPNTAEGLKQIPGVGDYTAGAIASIVFEQSTPVVDGNVIRVFSRMRSLGVDTKASSSTKLFWRLAGNLVPRKRPGCFNQALMELGATVCTPNNPQCDVCPVSQHCTAYSEAHEKQQQQTITSSCSLCLPDMLYPTPDVTKYPLKAKKTKQKQDLTVVALVEVHFGTKQQRLLCEKRPEDGLLAGLWQFPQRSVSEDEAAQLSVADANVDKLSKRIALDYIEDTLKLDTAGVSVQCTYLGTVSHLFSHIRQTMFVQRVVLPLQVGDETPALDASEPATQWVKHTDLGDMGVSKTVHKCWTLREKILNGKKVVTRINTGAGNTSSSSSSSSSASSSTTKGGGKQRASGGKQKRLMPVFEVNDEVEIVKTKKKQSSLDAWMG